MSQSECNHRCLQYRSRGAVLSSEQKAADKCVKRNYNCVASVVELAKHCANQSKVVDI